MPGAQREIRRDSGKESLQRLRGSVKESADDCHLETPGAAAASTLDTPCTLGGRILGGRYDSQAMRQHTFQSLVRANSGTRAEAGGPEGGCEPVELLLSFAQQVLDSPAFTSRRPASYGRDGSMAARSALAPRTKAAVRRAAHSARTHRQRSRSGQPQNAGGGARVGGARVLDVALRQRLVLAKLLAGDPPDVRLHVGCLGARDSQALAVQAQHLQVCVATSVSATPGRASWHKCAEPPHPPARAKVAPHTGRHCLCDIPLHVQVQVRQDASLPAPASAAPSAGALQLPFVECVHEPLFPSTCLFFSFFR